MNSVFATFLLTVFGCTIYGVVGFRSNRVVVGRRLRTCCSESAVNGRAPLPPDVLRATQKVRAMTGAGLSDCKSAVVDSNCDVDAAVSLLMLRGKTKTCKKDHITGSDGSVGLFIEGLRGVLVEVTCETDFVAKNEKFTNLVSRLVRSVWKSSLTKPDVQEIKNICDPTSGRSFGDEAQSVSAIFGESISILRSAIFEAQPFNVIGGYVHDAITQHGVRCGKIGTLVMLEASRENEPKAPDMTKLARSLALHITSERPSVIDKSELTEEFITKRRRLIESEAKENESSKNYHKMVEGKLQKVLKAEILMEQEFALEDVKRSVKQVLANFSAKNDAKEVKVRRFCTFAAGEVRPES